MGSDRVTQPVVTVITPTYNNPDTLVEAVESVRSQSYERWEQLVVDDGSDVPAAETLRHVNDPRVRVIRRQHVGIAGLASTYNAALQQARGELIAVLEDDDLWPRDKLAHQVPAFDDPDVVLSWGRAQWMDAGGSELGVLPNDPAALALQVRENRPPGTILREMLKRNIITACTVVVRASAVKALGGFLGADALYVDYPTWLQLATRGPFHFHDGVVGRWRVHALQTTATRTIEQEEGATRIALAFYDGLDPALRARARLTRAQVAVAGQTRVAEAHLRRGRFRAAGGDRKGALQDFRRAAGLGRGRTFRKALAALALTSMGLDVEAAVRMTGRIPVKSP